MSPFGPGDVGSKVTVRVRVHGTELDVVGDLLAYDDTGIVLRRRGGKELTATHADVLAGRVVPGRSDAAGRVADEAVEEIAARGWRGRETERLGGWLLRAADGWTGRANSALPLGDPGMPIESALAQVAQWYAARGLPARFQVPLPFALTLDEELGRRGWTAYNPTFFLAADLGPVRRSIPDAGIEVVLGDEPDDGWLAAYHYRGGTLPAVARDVLVDADTVTFASVRDGTDVVAIGRAVVDERWCGITAIEVAETHRRHGLGLAIMRGLLMWASGHGARHLYLQVAEENEPALALYRKLGVGVHHRYHYRLAPTS